MLTQVEGKSYQYPCILVQFTIHLGAKIDDFQAL